ncbi:MAG: asparagine synthase (glutamine-hydrolyzing) [Candidatus Coatesbacteria bacterium]|nr:asparagine synthase (glutamine-hydrolyzing) [Candidatus Coatesbacteria bacterium]
MCGICGIISFTDKKIDEKKLIKMRDSMLHRGPDDAGYYINNNVGLAQRRLSILDTSEAGKQPMFTADGKICIVYNGEFYNYMDYRNDIKEFNLKSRSDTEYILYLYKKYGIEETIKKINGIFAFAILDIECKKVFLARDRFGIKPLYIYEGKDFIAFASEYKAFFQLDDFTVSLNDEHFAEYFLFGWIQEGKTLLKNITVLPPANYMTIDLAAKKTEITGYYNLKHIKELTDISFSESLERFDKIFSKAVESQLISDVPLGVFLSGGLDSSLILAKMHELVPSQVRSFSMGYKEEYANEFKWSDFASRKYSNEHFKTESESSELFSLYPYCTWIYDDPLTAGTGFFQIARQSKPNATVMLCGQGSDELFAGYTSAYYANRQYKLNKLLSALLTKTGRKIFSTFFSKLGKSKLFTKAGRRLRFEPAMIGASYAASIPEDHYIEFLRNVKREDYENLLNLWTPLFYENSDDSFLASFLKSEIYSGLQIILQNTDRLTMAASIETRVPFLDNDIVEFAFSLPDKYKIMNGQGKYLLKEYAKKYYPDDFIYREKKGFPVPLFDWYKGDDFIKFQRVIETPMEEIDKHLNLSFLDNYKRIIDSGAMGQAMDAIYPVWRIFCIKIWWNNLHDNKLLSLDDWLGYKYRQYVPVK